MCRERKRTRDRLLEYDPAIMPLHPHQAGLAMIYPWEHISLSILENEIYTIAQNRGYNGTLEQFWSRFINGSLVRATLDTFPIPGERNTLYLDLDTDELYYFTTIYGEIPEELLARVGAAIVGYSVVGDSKTIEATYVYIPIRALLLEDTILNCGNSTEIIFG